MKLGTFTTDQVANMFSYAQWSSIISTSRIGGEISVTITDRETDRRTDKDFTGSSEGQGSNIRT